MKLFQALLLCVSTTLLYGNTIIIYNQGRAFVQEERSIALQNKGLVKFLVKDIPDSVDPSTIEIESGKLAINSKEYIYKPINEEALLNANIGKEIELVKYSEDGRSSSPITGLLISNTGSKVFEIDGKIVINPPFQYRFNEIPEELNNFPYLNCTGKAKSKNVDYTLSYIVRNLNWQAEYSLILTSHNSCEFKGWYSIQNLNNIAFLESKISLVSGSVLFADNRDINYLKRGKNNVSSKSTEPAFPQPHTTRLEDYAVFHLDEKVKLKSNSQARFSFLNNSAVPYKRIYQVAHSTYRPRRAPNSTENKLPVSIQIQLYAQDVSQSQLPAGDYKVYESINTQQTYVGSSNFPVVSDKDKIYLDIGKTRDVLCIFTINEYEINKNDGKVDVKAEFINKKDEPIKVEWIESFRDGRWEITQSASDYEKLDAFQVKFVVDIPEKQTKEFSFKAKIEKN